VNAGAFGRGSGRRDPAAISGDLAGTARVESDHRVEHLDRDPWVGDNGAGKMNPREIGDADLVGPGKRPQTAPATCP
jgi:hypothetical protein